MTRIRYVPKRFSAESREVIDQANGILEEYARQDFELTLRQLFYQFVARGLLANTVRSYKRLGNHVRDARLAGLMDWELITDRTRNLRFNLHWSDPEEILASAGRSYRVDRWGGQPFRPEVWIEKDALLGVIEPTCRELDVPYFSCRGYNSETEMWLAAQRFLEWDEGGQVPTIFHLADHDPSGLDMTRDIQSKMKRFAPGVVMVRRLALNIDQVEEFNPPPNPTKTTDSRAAAYIAQFGENSWELDALEPRSIANLIREAVESLRDEEAWEQRNKEEREGRAALQDLAERWPLPGFGAGA